MLYQKERTHGCRVSDAWSYQGLKTCILENEIIRVMVLVDKGADIYQFVHKPTDTDFLWKSPWGVRNPSKFIPTSGDPTSTWIDVYEGGWQTVMPAGGFPSKVNGADLGLHAEANLLPWDNAIIKDTEEEVSVKFWVRTNRTPFYFEKTLSIKSNRPYLQVDESIINEGEEEAHCSWGEHIALGPPFLSDSCIIDIPGGNIENHNVKFDPNNTLKPGNKSTWPFTEDINGKQLDLSKVRPKSAKAYDQSYITDMSQGWYAITNQELNVGWAVSYSHELFKYLWYWQSLGGGFGYPWYGRCYNIGLEPFTSYSNEGLAGAIKNGTALKLKPNQKITTSLKAITYTGINRVKNVASDGSIEAR